MNSYTESPAVIRRVRASAAQESRWRGSAFDVVNRIYRLRGPLVVEALEAAFDAVTARHESLRCSLQDDGELMMIVHVPVRPSLHVISAQGGDGAEREAWLASWLKGETSRPFDRRVPPLIRATLVRMGSDDHVLALVLDHIIADGWSVAVLAGELTAGYCEAIGAESPPLDELAQYPDWVVRERAARTEELLADRTRFWGGKFPGGPPDVGVWLSGYRPSAEPPSTTGTLEAVLDPELTAGLRRAARQLQVTLNVLTAAVLVRILQRDTGQDRITLSTSSASRFAPETASVIGYLATTIWISTTLRGADDLPGAVLAFQSAMHEVMAKADVPARTAFERLWGLGARAAIDAVPQVGFLCTPLWGDSLALPGVEVEASEYEEEEADSTLSVYLTDRGSMIDVQVRFFVETLAKESAEEILAGYVGELAAAAAQYG